MRVRRKDVITARQLRPYLARCGYQESLLREGYAYADSLASRTVPLVGFAHPTYDARDVCLAAVDASSATVEPFEEFAATYRGLGAPVLFICCQNKLQWWKLTTNRPEHQITLPAGQVGNFFDRHCEEFAPQRIYRAKTIGRIDRQYQLGFVDIGLMPLVEKEMGQRLAGLMTRVLEKLYQELGRPTRSVKVERWLFQSAFWLLGAKVLQDKRVNGFMTLELADVPDVFQRIERHYNASGSPQYDSRKRRLALEAASQIIADFASLSNLSIESLAHVYEEALVTKETRRALGTHATPSYLVDYIVWQLSPWIEKIPANRRVVLEPTCGHAPFLVAAARLLRDFLGSDDPRERHTYLKDHLIGLEVEPFATEIARLSLTLADVPNPNGWQLKLGDVYEGNTLPEASQKATILLGNPPFQDFTVKEKSAYAKRNISLTHGNKATEILARTLPYMSQGSVVGIVLPRGFLHSADASAIRRMLVEDFQIHEICELPDNVFASSDQESVVILGRKHKGRNTINQTRFVRVREKTVKDFRDRYDAPAESVSQARFKTSPYDLRVPELGSVWEYCQGLARLEVVADVGKGLEYKGRKKLPPNSKTIDKRKFSGAVQGYAKFRGTLGLTAQPVISWLSLDSDVIRRPNRGTQTGTPQILLNYAPVSRGPWRLMALIDQKGCPVTSSFLVVRPRTQDWPLEVFWAILNSPLANAYAFCHSGKRTILGKTIRNMPLPNVHPDALSPLCDLVRNYFKLYSSAPEALRSDTDTIKARQCMLAIDAAVMHLYDLPPKLERQVLDLFAGWQRSGVDFEFTRYFPPDFESYIPLHIYLSDEYQRSNAAFVNQWVEEVRSPELVKVFEAAMEAFGED